MEDELYCRQASSKANYRCWVSLCPVQAKPKASFGTIYFNCIDYLHHLHNPPRWGGSTLFILSSATHRIRCTAPLGVHVDLDVRCRGCVVPERQRASLVKDPRDALRVLQRTGDVRCGGERAYWRVAKQRYIRTCNISAATRPMSRCRLALDATVRLRR